MKLCTVVKANDIGDIVEVVETSLVPDDHAFGWEGDRLHIEGRITEVTTVASRSGEQPPVHATPGNRDWAGGTDEGGAG